MQLEYQCATRTIAQRACKMPRVHSWTRNQLNSIRRFVFDWVWQSNMIKHLILCEFDYWTNQINWTNSNSVKPNPVQFCLDCISWCLKWSMICRNNHDQPLLNCMNKQELRNWTFRYGSIEFDCGPFSTPALDCIPSTSFSCEFDYVTSAEPNWTIDVPWGTITELSLLTPQENMDLKQ